MVSAGCAYKLAGGSPRCRGGNLAHEPIRNCDAQKSPHPPPLGKVLQGFQWVDLQHKEGSDARIHYLL